MSTGLLTRIERIERTIPPPQDDDACQCRPIPFGIRQVDYRSVLAAVLADAGPQRCPRCGKTNRIQIRLIDMTGPLRPEVHP